MSSTPEQQAEYIKKLEQYAEDMRKHAEALEQQSKLAPVVVKQPVQIPAFVAKLKDQLPTLVMLAVIAGLVFYKLNDKAPSDNVDNNDNKPPKAVVAEFFPELKNSYKATFRVAAEKVADGSIKTDKELFEFVEPALVEMRKEKQKPFDAMFDFALPRNEDGSFKGEKDFVKPAAKFLTMISESW